MFEQIYSGLLIVLKPINMLGLLGGFVLGFVFGAIPGLTSITAVILVLPFTYGMDIHLSLIIMVTAYSAAMYAGSIPAILFNTPGTSTALMTALDGYPLAMKGRAGKALGISAIASSAGELFGFMSFILFTSFLSELALFFEPADYFALMIFGMSAITSLGKGNQVKCLISLAFGILVATIGVDEFRGLERLTFGSRFLLSGFQLVPVLAGILVMSEIFSQFEKRGGLGKSIVNQVSLKLPSLKEIWKLKFSIIKGSIIGVIIGILPGEGGTIAATIAYNEEKRWSKHPEEFGTGKLEGIAAAESANNAASDAALIPTLALGIPGSPTSAALMGAFLIKGIFPGPTLVIEKPTLVTAIFLALVFGSMLIFAFGFYGVRMISKILLVPYKYIAPVIIMFCIWGTYSIRNNPWDIWVVVIFGVIGYLMNKYGYSLVSFTLGFILGPLTESYLIHTIRLYENPLYSIFTRPLSGTLLLLSIFALLYPLTVQILKKVKK